MEGRHYKKLKIDQPWTELENNNLREQVNHKSGTFPLKKKKKENMVSTLAELLL